MRNISFAATPVQLLAGMKNVTRRIGWKKLQEGQILQAILKGQGLRKGEKVQKLGYVKVISLRSERLDAITDEDVEAEGFPGKSHYWFIEKFMDAFKCKRNKIVLRIEFTYSLQDPTPKACGSEGEA